MPCADPITILNKGLNQKVSCGQCLSCRIKRQSGMALRAILENCTSGSGHFITLTYAISPENLDYKDIQDFLKRLRKFESQRSAMLPIRYLCVGEYGSKTGRPHWHLLIWNAEHLDQVSLGKLWPQGFVYTGNVTAQSIKYTARYCLKFAEKGKEGFAHWSMKPGLGAAGMISLAEYMKNRGEHHKTPPKLMTIDGSKYAVDPHMQKIFMSVFGGETRSLITANLRWATELKLGDPIEKQRASSYARNQMFETARCHNETF